MLTVHQLSKSYNLQQIFSNVSFSLNPGERVGLIGPNGCGKTTLVRILSGQEQPDSGHVSYTPSLRIGYLPQGFDPGLGDASLSLGALLGQVAGDPQALESELAEVAAGLVSDPGNSSLVTRYDQLLQRIEFAETGRAAAILAGLDLDQIEPDLPCGYLSGGQKTRLSLALILLRDPQLTSARRAHQPPGHRNARVARSLVVRFPWGSPRHLARPHLPRPYRHPHP